MTKRPGISTEIVSKIIPIFAQQQFSIMTSEFASTSDQGSTSDKNTSKGFSISGIFDGILNNGRNRNIFFVCVLIVNLLIKSNGIGINSLDYDESISLKEVSLDFGHIKHEAEWDNNPPFYYYCIWVWHHIFEINEVNARVLSLIFSALAIALFGRFVFKRLNFATALGIAMALTAHTMLLYHAQQARSYSLTLLLVVISTITFFNYLEKRKLQHALLLGLINFLLVYTHYISGIILLIQGFVVFTTDKKLLPKYLISYLICAILIAVRFTKKQFLNILGFNSTGNFWLQKPGEWELNDSLNSLSNNAVVKILFLSACIYLLIQLFVKSNESKQRALIIYTLLASIFTISTLFIVSLAKPMFLSRYMIFCVPFIYLTIALVIAQIFSEKYTTPVILVVALISVLSYKFTYERNENYRLFANTVKDLKQKDDVVIINTADDTNLFTYYFDKKLFLKKNLADELSTQNVFSIREAADIKNFEGNFRNRIILIQQFQQNANSHSAFDYLSSQYEAYFQTGDTSKISLVFLRRKGQ